MILEELTLRNWRRLREQRSFVFDRGINVLCGENESGKSSLVEATMRALLDPHGSRAKELRSIRPLGSEAGPEVWILLSHGERRYRIHKRFLSDPLAEVSQETNPGEFSLLYDGDAADRFLRRLFATGANPARGGAKPQHRGLAQALWFLQDDASLPAGSWNEGLKRGLADLIEASLEGPASRRVLELLEKRRAELFTPTGRLLKSSELAKVEEEIAGREKELASRQEELNRSSRLRGELRDIDENRQTAQGELRQTLAAIVSLDAAIAAGLVHQETLRSLVSRLENARQRESRLQTRLAAVFELEAAQRANSEAIGEAEKLEAQWRNLVRLERRAAEIHARRAEEELEPKVAAVRREITELEASQRIEKLERLRDLLVARRRRAQGLERRLIEVDKELSTVPPVDAAVEAAGVLEERRRFLEQALGRSAFEIRLDLPGADGAQSRGAVELGQDGGWTVIGVGAIDLPGLGSISFRPSDPATIDHAAQLETLRSHQEGLLRGLGLESLTELYSLAERRRELGAQRELLAARLAELFGPREEGEGSVAALTDQLREVTDELARLQAARPQRTLPGLEGWAQARANQQLRELGVRLRELEQRLKEERASENEAQGKCFSANERLVEAAQAAATLRHEAKSLRERVARELLAIGDREALDVALVEAKAAVAEHEAERLRIQQLLEQQVEKPRRELAAAQGLAQGRERDVRRLDDEATDRRARLHELAGRNLGGAADDLQGELRYLGARRESLARRVEAVGLLSRLVEAERSQEARSLVGPVATLVDRWWQELSDHPARSVRLDERLLPAAIADAGLAADLPFEWLSHGAKEQVVVLLRLALAVLLSQGERHLVVLDDRLVNADPQRMARLCRVLEEVGGACQLLIVTCRPESYTGLSGKRLSIESPKQRFPSVALGG